MDTKEQNQFKISKRVKSFSYAVSGVKTFLKTQHNAWIHLSAALLVIIMGNLYHVDIMEWCMLIFAIGLVFTVEALNTAIEYLTDLVSPSYNEKAGKVKDIAAGAVLIAAITACIIGLAIFVPKIYLSFH